MSEFDKTTYWRNRMLTKVNVAFDNVSALVADLRDTYEHIQVDPREVEKALMIIGEGFNQLQSAVKGEKLSETKN